MLEWTASIKSEMRTFERLEGLQEAVPVEKSPYKGRLLPCKMVFVRTLQTPQQIKESNTTKTWKAKSRM
eukprot:8000257-Prorocentrum_lima.AAC.1